MSFTNLAALEWANRTPDEFMQSMLVSSGVHSRYSIYDDIKDKMSIPIFDGSLVFTTDFCKWEPGSSVDITEKEFSTENYKWAFQNCKTALQRTFRSELLTKGANNEQTLDEQLKDWIFMHFSALSAKHIGAVATEKIQAEIDADGNVIKATSADLEASKDPTQVLGVLAKVFKNISKEMYLSHFNPNGVIVNKKNSLAIILPWEMFQAAHIALSSKLSFEERAEIEAGRLPLRFMGIDLLLNPDADESNILVGQLSNFVTVVDDLSDVRAIQMKYIEEINSDYIWGQFTIGFSYKVSEEILHYKLTAA